MLVLSHAAIQKGPWVQSNEMSETLCPKTFCFRHLLEIKKMGLVLIFKDCICHFLFITICYPGAKQSRWYKTFTQIPKMVFEFNVGSFHHLNRFWVSHFSFCLFQQFHQIQIQPGCISVARGGGGGRGSALPNCLANNEKFDAKTASGFQFPF